MPENQAYDNIRRDISEIAISVARIDERTRDLPELKKQVHELHTHVTHRRGERMAITKTTKWILGIVASLVTAGLLAIAASLI